MTTPYQRPSFEEVKSRVTADLSAVPAALRDPLSAALARAHHSEHAHLDWIARQCSPLTCSEEWLIVWAFLYRVERLAAVAASGTVLATGAVGAVVLKDAVLNSNNGKDYVVTAATALSAGATAVPVVCVDAGAAGNLAAGVLTLVDPIAGVNATFTASPALTGGAEQESVEAWRARVVDEWQSITVYGARSGKPDDYIFWAKSAHPSVTGALVRPHALGIGTVLVQPICNGLANRLPSAAVLAAVQEKLYNMAPATADWRVSAPNIHTFGVTLHLNSAVDTLPNRTAIAAALSAATAQEGGKNAVLQLAEVDAAVAQVTTQYTRVAPVADVVAADGEVLVFFGVTWQ